MNNAELISISNGKSNFRFLPTGDVFDFTYESFKINTFCGNALDGSINNIYLRVYGDDIKVFPLLGVKSYSSLKKGKNSIVYEGVVQGISYTVTFFLSSQNTWLWDVKLSGNSEYVDIIYAQDIGVAHIGAIASNELYAAQYLGHSVLSNDNGYVICSRQNQGGVFPYLQQGMLKGRAVHFLTDGMQFYGQSYKKTGVPESLYKDLPDVNYQFEFSLTALQTEKVRLDNLVNFVFYGHFIGNHVEAIKDIEYMDEIAEDYKNFKSEALTECVMPKKNAWIGAPFISEEIDEETVFEMFPNRKLEERDNNGLLSFFTDKHSHVVLQRKEILVERAHGTIITTAIKENKIHSDYITSTNYIHGVFNSQTVIGNTSMNKMTSTFRGLLNILKSSGQRIYVKINEYYRILDLPAIYEMGMNYSKWYYILPDDMLIVTVFAVSDETDIVLDVKSKSGIKYDYIITNQLVMGSNEFENEVEVKTLTEKAICISRKQGDKINSIYPNLHYVIQIDSADFTWSDDRVFYEHNNVINDTMLTMSVKSSNNFRMVIRGSLEEKELSPIPAYLFETEFNKYLEIYRGLINGFLLQPEFITDGEAKNEVDKLNETAWWYTHNAMVHFTSPHGLEQPGGAAWGTRDVCQGPFEFFMATQNFAMVRSILIKVFAYQNNNTGEWPQWFMFDKYPYAAGECHGDVVFWPLKCIGDYLRATNDINILTETINGEELISRVKCAFDAIKQRFIKDTGLITYAGGDWDDTLQPAHEELKNNLVSAWTVALAYQTLKQLGEVIGQSSFAEDLAKTADKIKEDFNKLLIKDDVIAGFVAFEDSAEMRMLLHPSDNETGINYRLLPMTRSIISEIVDKAQAEKNVKAIHDNLRCPDGVRLMNRPASYEGGVSKLFMRAEQAANVGREVSLQYVHAHIRYVEAMAKLGEGDTAWKALFNINPIGLREVLPNAFYRQSNMYYSSSDGNFLDRYEYSRDFDKLFDGSIGVKGGWRLYSSGPGIYMSQVICNILGIRTEGSYIVIDPVLPVYMDGLRFSFKCFGVNVSFEYHISSDNKEVRLLLDNEVIESTQTANPYRRNGIKVKIESLMLNEDNLYRIYC